MFTILSYENKCADTLFVLRKLLQFSEGYGFKKKTEKHE